MYAISYAFRRGVAIIGEIFYWAAHTVVGPHFRYMECIGRWRFDEAVIMKEADVWP